MLVVTMNIEKDEETLTQNWTSPIIRWVPYQI